MVDSEEISHSNKIDRNVNNDNNSNTLTLPMFDSNSSNYHYHTLHKNDIKVEMTAKNENNQS